MSTSKHQDIRAYGGRVTEGGRKLQTFHLFKDTDKSDLSTVSG